MKKNKLTYVVLHYQNIDITRKCISSLLLVKDKVSEIVIVDNNSPNKSGQELKEEFEKCNDIHIIINEKNLGFAKGNNLGFVFAKNTIMSDFIVVMNSDIIISQKDFEEKIYEHYELNKSHLIAPDILNLRGIHQNPYKSKKTKSITVFRRILSNSFLFLISFLPFIKSFVPFYIKKKKEKSNILEQQVDENQIIIPHGSCIIFTPKYVAKEDIAFLPWTFLFVEEDLLYEYISSKNYKVTMSFDLNVLHMEDASIDAISRDKMHKIRFLLRHQIYSMNIYLLMKIKLLRYNSK